LGLQPDGPDRAHARLRLATGWLHAELLAMAMGCDLPPRAVPLADLGERIGLLAGAAGVTLPYLAAAAYHGGERRFAESMGEEFFGVAPPGDGPVRALVFTDTFDELNGVAGTMRRLAEAAADDPALGVTVLACRPGRAERPGLVSVPPVARMPVPA